MLLKKDNPISAIFLLSSKFVFFVIIAITVLLLVNCRTIDDTHGNQNTSIIANEKIEDSTKNSNSFDKLKAKHESISINNLYSIIDYNSSETRIIDYGIYKNKVIVLEEKSKNLLENVATIIVNAYNWDNSNNKIIHSLKLSLPKFAIGENKKAHAKITIIDDHLLIYDSISEKLYKGNLQNNVFQFLGNLNSYNNFENSKVESIVKEIKLSPSLDYFAIPMKFGGISLVSIKDKTFTFSKKYNLFSPNLDDIFLLDNISILYDGYDGVYDLDISNDPERKLPNIYVISNSLGVITDRILFPTIETAFDSNIPESYFWGFIDQNVENFGIPFLQTVNGNMFLGSLDIEKKKTEHYLLKRTNRLTTDDIDTINLLPNNFICISDDGKIVTYKSSDDGLLTVFDIVNENEIITFRPFFDNKYKILHINTEERVILTDYHNRIWVWSYDIPQVLDSTKDRDNTYSRKDVEANFEMKKSSKSSIISNKKSVSTQIISSNLENSKTEIVLSAIEANIKENNLAKLINKRDQSSFIEHMKESLTGLYATERNLEFGKLIHAEYLILVRLLNASGKYIVNCQLVEVETGEIISSEFIKKYTVESLLQSLYHMVKELFTHD